MSQQGMRVFSTAFKEAAVVRLAAGERLAAVARELGIARKLLYEWRGAPRRGAPARAGGPRRLRRLPFPNWRGRRPGSPSSSARSADRRSTSIFFAKPCVSSTRGTLRLARRHLRGHPSDERAGDARRLLDPASVRARRRFARRLLSPWRGWRAGTDGGGPARQDSEDRAAKPLLRLSAGVSGPLAHPWPEGQLQACSAADARGQSVVSAREAFRPLHNQQPT